MYRLYDFALSGNCYKLRLLLHHLKISYDRVPINILSKETRTTDFLAINPNGRVPVLEVDGKHLPESNAALWYLANDSDYLPCDKFEQAQVLQWMCFEQYSHEPYIATPRYWIHILGKQIEYQSEINQRRSHGYAALDVMEAHLQNHAWFVGENYSIADIALFAYTHVAGEARYNLSPYEKINDWIRRVRRQPGFITMRDSAR